MYVSGDYAYVADSSGGVVVLQHSHEVSEPFVPVTPPDESLGGCFIATAANGLPEGPYLK